MIRVVVAVLALIADDDKPLLEDNGPQVAVVAGAESGGAAMILIVVVTVILCSRRLKRSMSIDEQADGGDYNYIDESLLANQVNLSEEATEGVHNDPPVNGRYLSIEELEDGGEYNYINDSLLDNQVTKVVHKDRHVNGRYIASPEKNDPYYLTPSVERPPRPNNPTHGRKTLANDEYQELDSFNVASTNGLNVGDKDGFLTTLFIDAPPPPPRLLYRTLSENDDPYYITPCSEIRSRTIFTTYGLGGRVINGIKKRATKVPGSPSWREFDDNDGLLAASSMDVPSQMCYRRLSENDDPYYITPCSDIRPRPTNQMNGLNVDGADMDGSL